MSALAADPPPPDDVAASEGILCPVTGMDDLLPGAGTSDLCPTGGVGDLRSVLTAGGSTSGPGGSVASPSITVEPSPSAPR